jgi:hypothetical protein
VAPLKQDKFVFGALLGAVVIIVWMNSERLRLQAQVTGLKAELAGRSESPKLIPDPIGIDARAPPQPPPGGFEVQAGVQASSGSAGRGHRLDEFILRVEGKYGQLFSRLKNWPPERREALKHRLAENELGLIRIMQASDAPLTPEGVQIRTDALMKAVNENTRLLREMMGEADYEKLDSFERERSSKEPISTITNAMRANGVDVSGNLEASILTTYAIALNEAAAQASKVDPSSLSSTELEDLKLRQRHAFQLILLRRMSAVLDDTQLNAFMASLLDQQHSTGL